MCGLVLSVYDDLRGFLLFTFNSLPSLRLRLLTLRFETVPYICTMRIHRYRYLWLHGSYNQLGRITYWLEGRYENEAEEDQPRLHDL